MSHVTAGRGLSSVLARPGRPRCQARSGADGLVVMAGSRVEAPWAFEEGCDESAVLHGTRHSEAVALTRRGRAPTRPPSGEPGALAHPRRAGRCRPRRRRPRAHRDARRWCPTRSDPKGVIPAKVTRVESHDASPQRVGGGELQGGVAPRGEDDLTAPQRGQQGRGGPEVTGQRQRHGARGTARRPTPPVARTADARAGKGEADRPHHGPGAEGRHEQPEPARSLVQHGRARSAGPPR